MDALQCMDTPVPLLSHFNVGDMNDTLVDCDIVEYDMDSTRSEFVTNESSVINVPGSSVLLPQRPLSAAVVGGMKTLKRFPASNYTSHRGVLSKISRSGSVSDLKTDAVFELQERKRINDLHCDLTNSDTEASLEEQRLMDNRLCRTSVNMRDIGTESNDDQCTSADASTRKNIVHSYHRQYGLSDTPVMDVISNGNELSMVKKKRKKVQAMKNQQLLRHVNKSNKEEGVKLIKKKKLLKLKHEGMRNIKSHVLGELFPKKISSRKRMQNGIGLISEDAIPPVQKVRKSRFQRRNIRQVLNGVVLDKQTKLAQKEEAERLHRLQEIRDFQRRQSLESDVDQNRLCPVEEKNYSSHLDEDCGLEAANVETPAHAQVKQSLLNYDVVEISSAESDNETVEATVVDKTEVDIDDNFTDFQNYPDKQGRVLVNVGHPADENDVYLNPRLAASVKRHQIGGIRFLYDNLIESSERFRTTEGLGCILAHSMGLGKTLQVISFVDVFLRCVVGARSVLIIVPVNTLQNWANEFNMWLPVTPSRSQEESSADNKSNSEPARTHHRAFPVYIVNEMMKTNSARASVIAQWQYTGGVLLLGYEMFRLLTCDRVSKKPKRFASLHPEIIDVDLEDHRLGLMKDFHSALVRPGPDIVICDEGHRIKNSGASTSRALKNIRTRRRLVLTGYPLQNNLIEYWCMVDFVRPNYLGSRQEFSNMFERPIVNGQCKDSTSADVRLMRYRSHVLHNLLKGFVQRRGHDVLASSLPQKEEYVILIRMSPIQRQLYREFIMQIKTSGLGAWGSSNNPIKAFSVCCKIWNHPDILYQYANSNKDDSDPELEETIVPQDNLTTACAKRKKNSRLRAKVNASPELGLHDGELGQGRLKVISYDWAFDLMQGYKTGNIENSGKMVVLMELVELAVKMGEKILVFSQSILTLNLIEDFMNKRFVPNANTSWAKNRNYLRIDGTTSSLERERLINLFNVDVGKQFHLFLLSTRAGCLGINLVSASRVVVFDASWNPCHDCQAVCRIYRFGQSRRSYVYRLIADNTMEHCIYDRQISKQGISDRIVDEMNPQSLLSRRQIEELLRFEDVEVPLLNTSGCETNFSDTALVDVLRKHGRWITKMPFTHDSLLFDCKDQKLTSQEKLLAEHSFVMDKRTGVRPQDKLPSSRFSSVDDQGQLLDNFMSPIGGHGSFWDARSPNESNYSWDAFTRGSSDELWNRPSVSSEQRFCPKPSDSDDIIFTGTSFCNSMAVGKDRNTFPNRPFYGRLDALSNSAVTRYHQSHDGYADDPVDLSSSLQSKQLEHNFKNLSSSTSIDLLQERFNSHNFDHFNGSLDLSTRFNQPQNLALLESNNLAKRAAVYGGSQWVQFDPNSSATSKSSDLVNSMASSAADNSSTTPLQHLMADHGKSLLRSGRVVQVKPGVSIQMIELDRDMHLPQPSGGLSSKSEGHIVPAGEKIHVIQTPKGLYIRTRQGKIFAVHRGDAPAHGNTSFEIDSRSSSCADGPTSLPQQSMVKNYNGQSEFNLQTNSLDFSCSSYVAEPPSNASPSWQNYGSKSAAINSKCWHSEPPSSRACNESTDRYVIDAGSLWDGSSANALALPNAASSLSDYNSFGGQLATPSNDADTSYDLGADLASTLGDADTDYSLGADLGTTMDDIATNYSSFGRTNTDFNYSDTCFDVSINRDPKILENKTIDLSHSANQSSIFDDDYGTNQDVCPAVRQSMSTLPMKSTRKTSDAVVGWPDLSSFVPDYSDLLN